MVGKSDTTEPTCIHRTCFRCAWEECAFCCCYGVLHRCLLGLIGIYGKVLCNTWGAIKFFFPETAVLFLYSHQQFMTFIVFPHSCQYLPFSIIFTLAFEMAMKWFWSAFSHFKSSISVLMLCLAVILISIIESGF